MNWFSFLKPIIGIVEKPLVEWQKRKTLQVELDSKIQDREHEVRLKKVDIAFELAKQGLNAEKDWDSNAQEQMKHSLKDEWFVLLFSIPLVMAFIPDTQIYILKGFEILEQTPVWYRWLIIGIVSATFGLRWMFGKFNLKGK